MFSSSGRSSKRFGRVFVGIVLALLTIAIFAGLEAWGAAGPATPVAAATLTAADLGRAAGEPPILEAAASLGHEAVQMLTAMFTAVFDAWKQPIDAALGWLDDVRRGWTAVYRFTGSAVPRS